MILESIVLTFSPEDETRSIISQLYKAMASEFLTKSMHLYLM